MRFSPVFAVCLLACGQSGLSGMNGHADGGRDAGRSGQDGGRDGATNSGRDSGIDGAVVGFDGGRDATSDGGRDGGFDGGPDSGAADALRPEDDPLRCDPGVVAVADEGRDHVPSGVPVTYHHNPPASGSHWPSPHPWGVFLDVVIPPEQFVHNLEHGGIVLLANCPPPDAGADAQCAEIERVFRSLYASQPLDKWGEVRMLLTRDPLLPTRAAAVAWDYAWTFDVPDEAALRCFRDARYGKGPEDAP